MTYLPIYQDKKHTFASSDSLVHYTITDANDNLLYEGSAYRKPGQEKAFIYIIISKPKILATRKSACKIREIFPSHSPNFS